MDKQNRQFFNALNRIEHNENESIIDVIDINNITIEELADKYEKYAIWYNNFMKYVSDPEKRQQCRNEKNVFDKMYRFWINPYHIALRNTIGKINAVNQEKETIIPDKGDKARITQETINKIKAEISGIASEINEGEVNILYPDEQNENVYKIAEIETYTFDTGLLNQMRSYIKKYKVSFEEDEIEYSKQVYGEIDINKFKNDKNYRKLILETIEDLEIRNYSSMEKQDYIGSFHLVTKNDKKIWQHSLKDGEIDAINRIKRLKEKYIKELKSEENMIDLGDER